MHFADRLMEACEQKQTVVCAGIDPVAERLPGTLPAAAEEGSAAVLTAFEQFVAGVLEAVAPHVACVKLQSACFERYLWPGVELYHRLVERARRMGLIVIADAKRGDIGISAAHYAAGCLGDPALPDLPVTHGPDALTLNSYLGTDAMEPFLDLARTQEKGLFALVRTSNPGSDVLQGLTLADGRRVAEAVAQMVAEAGAAAGLVGESGYSLLGAVVGATKAQDAAALRALMPEQIFLVPGFGAQGGGAEDVKACFHEDGRGAIITASRSILYAFEKTPERDWRTAVGQAAKEMKEQLQAILA